MLKITSTTDTLDSSYLRTSYSMPSQVGLILAGFIIVAPSYGSLNPNSFMENKTASRSIYYLNKSAISYSNSGTKFPICTYLQNNEGLKKINENVEYEEDTEDLLNWDIWIENPLISKTMTVNAQFIEGTFMPLSIDEDLDG